jgi:hypothetical protein
MKNDVEEIRRIGERLLEAENTGTADDFGKFLAEDVVILAPYLPALEGKPACLYMRSDGVWKVFRIIFHYDDRAGEGDEA